MRILVTGGAGFLGASLARRLHEDGHHLVLIDNLRHGSWSRLVVGDHGIGSFHVLDVRDPAIYSLFEGIDLLFHFAAISNLAECQADPQEAYSVNVGGTANVLEGARRAGIPIVIFASSSAVYEQNLRLPCDENARVFPTLIYSMTKKAAEDLCQSYFVNYGLKARCLRYFNIHGPLQDYRRQNPPLINRVIYDLLHGKAPVVWGSGEQKRDYIHVEDALDLTLLAAHHKRAKELDGRCLNVGSGKQVTVNEIVDIVRSLLGEKDILPDFRKPADSWDSHPSLSQGALPLKEAALISEVYKKTQADIGQAQRLFKWKPRVSLYEGIRANVEHLLRTEGDLSEE
jgi:nucleoside-diphosphate-sugar epimerase